MPKDTRRMPCRGSGSYETIWNSLLLTLLGVIEIVS